MVGNTEDNVRGEGEGEEVEEEKGGEREMSRVGKIEMLREEERRRD
jgi:hypothetical protein